MRDTNWQGTESAFLDASWQSLTPAVAMVIFATLLKTLRWKVLLPNEKVSFTRLYLVRHAGQSVNQLLPMRVAGEATEFAMLTQADNIEGGKVVASIFMNRALDLVVTTTLICIGFFWVPQLSAFKPVVIPSIVLATVIIGLFLLSERIGRVGFLRRVRPLQSSLGALTHWKGHHVRLALAVAITAAAWLSLGTGAWLIAQGVGIALPFWMMAILLVVMTSFTSVIPAGPGSVGVFEFSGVYTLGLFTVDASSALTFALIVHALLFLPSLIIGVPVLSREHKTVRGTAKTVGRFFVKG